MVGEGRWGGVADAVVLMRMMMAVVHRRCRHTKAGVTEVVVRSGNKENINKPGLEKSRVRSRQEKRVGSGRRRVGEMVSHFHCMDEEEEKDKLLVGKADTNELGLG